LAGFRIPDLDALVSRGCAKSSGIFGPGDRKDASFMFSFTYLTLKLARFAIIKSYLPIRAYADE
jgi:hypothetical protein